MSSQKPTSAGGDSSGDEASNGAIVVKQGIPESDTSSDEGKEDFKLVLGVE